MPWVFRKNDIGQTKWVAEGLNYPRVHNNVKCPYCSEPMTITNIRGEFGCPKCRGLLDVDPVAVVKAFDTDRVVTGSKGTRHHVKCASGKWTCTCIGYKTRKKDCKHIKQVKANP